MENIIISFLKGEFPIGNIAFFMISIIFTIFIIRKFLWIGIKSSFVEDAKLVVKDDLLPIRDAIVEIKDAVKEIPNLNVKIAAIESTIQQINIRLGEKLSKN